MSENFVDRRMPHGALFGAAAIVGFALIAVSASRFKGIGEVHMPAAAAIESRTLRFDDAPGGRVEVRDVLDGHVFAVLTPGADGFIRTAVRGLARDRFRGGVAASEPFRLIRRADKSFILEDSATKRQIDLRAFGQANADSFERLFAATEAAQ